MDIYHVKLTFTEPLLGTVPLDRNVAETYVLSKGAAPEEESETLPSSDELLEKMTTGFHEMDGAPAIYDYAIKGFFKDACSMLRRVSQSGSAKLTAYKKVIDGMLFIEPRWIPLVVNGETFVLERPLRAQTAQGERVALARSVAAPAGSTLEFDVLILGGVSKALLEEWLTYGRLRGMGAWRNGGWGSFVYEIS